MFKSLFCKHEYVESKLGRLARSRRVGNDNHVIKITDYKCKKCNKSYTEEVVDKIEKDFYIKAGDILIADKYCGFPDSTTQGKEYMVSRVEEFADKTIFWIIDDNGEERLPVSTTFKRKLTK